MKAHVLIIEDEQEIAELIQLYLKKEGIDSFLADSAEKGMDFLLQNAVDLILLDINLPGKDGFEFLQQFRKTSNIPVIIVSARESDEDTIMGLAVGADDFVSKPFSPRVLSAKVRAFLRRSLVFSQDERKIYRFGAYILDYDGYNLKKEGQLVALSGREFEILRLFVDNSGIAFSPQDIYDKVWGQDYGDISAVSVYVQRIRKKIEKDYRNPEYIKTIHGKGYLFPREKIL
ncbi:response regulator transcription factor [uncultured Sphaerochaeta sp.]|uniref:response regulator transcription factor n=1 Tax=uncultured Sphaerochaeta sp. TaxID=886478 RepID=UPI002A0A7CF8|nr:response regulator transcription factor [uncultured Sphaerochaeta sp.]